MNGGDEGSGELCAARSDFPPTLEGAEDVFNDVPCPIQFMTVRSLLFSTFNRRDDGCYISFLKHTEQFVRVIRLIRRGNASASKSSIWRGAWLQSATVPLVTMPLAGIPYSSTARCNLLFSPLLYG